MRPFEVPKRIGPVVVSEEFEKFHPMAVISCPLNLPALNKQILKAIFFYNNIYISIN